MMTIIPHQGAGNIRFGMTRAEVAQEIGRVPRRPRLGEYALSDIDFFEGQDFFGVDYDANDRCCAIQFSDGGARAVYDGYDLFAHSAHEVRAWARGRDPALEDKDGFVSRALGLSMYAPLIDEPDLDEEERSAPAQCF